MKRMLVSMLALVLSVASFSQMRAIPAEVTESFKSKFPNAKMVSWKDNLSNFEADFTNEGYGYEVKFNSKGEWLESAKKIEFKELKEDVKDGFQKSKYNDWEIRGVKEITSNENEVMYRILIKKNDLQKKYLFFSKKGQLKKEGIAI